MTIKAVDNCLLLLLHVARSDGPCGVADLARELSLPKSSVFRLLATLAAHGFVRQRDDARYEPTLRLWELGCMVVSRSSLTKVARPALERLAAQTGESAQLAVLDGADSVYIDKRDGPQPISGFTRIGTRAPAHCCATGKVELAFRNVDVLREFPRALAEFTDATLRTREALADELGAIRRAGVAVNRGEWVEDVWGVAAPIRNHTGGVCASIGVWGPRKRFSRELERNKRDVKAAAELISRGLGCPADLLHNPERSPS